MTQKSNQTISDQRVKSNSGLRPLEPILQEWRENIEFYSARIEEDAAYWYTEKANVSVLLGASWSTNNPALSEFGGYKNEANSREPFSKRGFYDLFIATARTHYSFEFKSTSWNMKSNRNAIHDLINKSLERAAQDAEAISSPKKLIDKKNRDFVIAGVFCRPYINKRKMNLYCERKNVDEKVYITEIILGLVERLKGRWDAVAWCFPVKTRMLEANDGTIVPGTIMALKNHTTSAS